MNESTRAIFKPKTQTKGEQQMEFLTNPWFIVVTVINIVAMVFLSIMFHFKNKTYESMLFDRLRDAEININIRKPIHPSNRDGETKTK